MVDDYGGTIDSAFPPAEMPKWAEWEVAAIINGTPAATYTEVKAWAMNHTAWPARVAKDVEYRYFFDVSEVLAGGLSIDDIKVIQPTGQSEHRDEVQFRISIPDAVDGKSTAGAWDVSNDWSYLGGLADATDLKKSDSLNEHMPMYVDGELAWGEEPDGTKFVAKPCAKSNSGSTVTTQPKDTTTTTTSTTTETTTTTTSTTSIDGNTTTTVTEGDPTKAATVWGDANCDGNVSVADAVLVMQSLANPSKFGESGSSDQRITAQGKINADVYENGSGITGQDALSIQRYMLNLVTKLPESYKA